MLLTVSGILPLPLDRPNILFPLEFSYSCVPWTSYLYHACYVTGPSDEMVSLWNVTFYNFSSCSVSSLITYFLLWLTIAINDSVITGISSHFLSWMCGYLVCSCTFVAESMLWHVLIALHNGILAVPWVAPLLRIWGSETVEHDHSHRHRRFATWRHLIRAVNKLGNYDTN